MVCGSVNVKNLRDFMTELFHEDHNENDFMNVVVLSPDVRSDDTLLSKPLKSNSELSLSYTYTLLLFKEPVKEILLLLRDNPLYENSVTYLVGASIILRYQL